MGSPPTAAHLSRVSLEPLYRFFLPLITMERMPLVPSKMDIFLHCLAFIQKPCPSYFLLHFIEALHCAIRALDRPFFRSAAIPCRKGTSLACVWVRSRFSPVWLFETLWTVACQAPLSVGFSRQEYKSGLLCPPPGDLPNPGIEPSSLMPPVLAGRFFTINATQQA